MLLTEIAIIVVLTLANGFFSGAEIAIATLRRHRVEELAADGASGAHAVLRLREEPERFLATVQIGITVVGASAAAFGGATLAEDLAPLLARYSWLAPHADGVALALVITAVSYLSIVVGELVPKSLALRAGERYALLVGRPLRALSFVARPLVWLLSASANVLLKPFGDSTTFTEARHSPDELKQLVGEAAQGGSVHPEAAKIASRALKLPELTAWDVMLPRLQVVAIARDVTGEDLRRILLEHSHSRMPVFEERIDNVVGYVSTKDVLALAWERDLIVLADLIRPAFFVPESKKAVELLKEMRKRRLPFAIVVDEYGGMSGIVTMEDLVEELVGEIFDEHESATGRIATESADGSVVVNGTARIHEVNRLLDVELPHVGHWSTLAGLLLDLSGRMPAVGDVFQLEPDLLLEVVDATPKRIRSVRIRRVARDKPLSVSPE